MVTGQRNAPDYFVWLEELEQLRVVLLHELRVGFVEMSASA